MKILIHADCSAGLQLFQAGKSYDVPDSTGAALIEAGRGSKVRDVVQAPAPAAPAPAAPAPAKKAAKGKKA